MNEQLALRLKLNSHTRLEDFVGEARVRLQELQGAIVVVGASGTGKSHLLEGRCHLALSSGRSAIYLQTLDSLRSDVLNELERFSLVCLDDIDLVLEDAAWQQALFHLMNACKDRGTTLVVSAKNNTALHNVTLPDLRSRLLAAYLLKTDELDDEQKLEVIARKAQRRGFSMPLEVCRFILSRSQRDMHHLARLVEQLDEETLKRQKRVTIPFVKTALGL